MCFVGSEDAEAVETSEDEGLDRSNIIVTGRRTRGKRVDYSKIDQTGLDDDEGVLA